MAFDTIKDLPELAGKVAIVTGSTSGIGFHVAQILVRKGATVYFAVRDETKAKAYLERIEAESTAPGNGRAVYLHLDLADPKEAKKAAEEFMKKEERLDILVNNAAITLVEYRATSMGVNETNIVNYFSPFVFTNTLLPLLKKTANEGGADVRIVNVGSEGHNLVPNALHFKTKEDFSISYEGKFLGSLTRYGVSKLLVLLWTRELKRRLEADAESIAVICADPSSCFTDGGKKIAQKFRWPLSSLVTFLMRLTMHSALFGAKSIVFAAASPSVRADMQKFNGSYLLPIGKFGKPSKQALNEDLAGELWRTTEELLKTWDV